MITKIYQLETLTCPSCSAKIQGMLKKIEGIVESEVLFNTSRVRISFDDSKIDSESIKSKLNKLGFEILGEK